MIAPVPAVKRSAEGIPLPVPQRQRFFCMLTTFITALIVYLGIIWYLWGRTYVVNREYLYVPVVHDLEISVRNCDVIFKTFRRTGAGEDPHEFSTARNEFFTIKHQRQVMDRYIKDIRKMDQFQNLSDDERDNLDASSYESNVLMEIQTTSRFINYDWYFHPGKSSVLHPGRTYVDVEFSQRVINPEFACKIIVFTRDLSPVQQDDEQARQVDCDTPSSSSCRQDNCCTSRYDDSKAVLPYHVNSFKLDMRGNDLCQLFSDTAFFLKANKHSSFTVQWGAVRMLDIFVLPEMQNKSISFKLYKGRVSLGFFRETTELLALRALPFDFHTRFVNGGSMDVLFYKNVPCPVEYQSCSLAANAENVDAQAYAEVFAPVMCECPTDYSSFTPVSKRVVAKPADKGHYHLSLRVDKSIVPYMMLAGVPPAITHTDAAKYAIVNNHYIPREEETTCIYNLLQADGYSSQDLSQLNSDDANPLWFSVSTATDASVANNLNIFMVEPVYFSEAGAPKGKPAGGAPSTVHLGDYDTYSTRARSIYTNAPAVAADDPLHPSRGGLFMPPSGVTALGPFGDLAVAAGAPAATPATNSSFCFERGLDQLDFAIQGWRGKQSTERRNIYRTLVSHTVRTEEDGFYMSDHYKKIAPASMKWEDIKGPFVKNYVDTNQGSGMFKMVDSQAFVVDDANWLAVFPSLKPNFLTVDIGMTPNVLLNLAKDSAPEDSNRLSDEEIAKNKFKFKEFDLILTPLSKREIRRNVWRYIHSQVPHNLWTSEFYNFLYHIPGYPSWSTLPDRHFSSFDRYSSFHDFVYYMRLSGNDVRSADKPKGEASFLAIADAGSVENLEDRKVIEDKGVAIDVVEEVSKDIPRLSEKFDQILPTSFLSQTTAASSALEKMVSSTEKAGNTAAEEEKREALMKEMTFDLLEQYDDQREDSSNSNGNPENPQEKEAKLEADVNEMQFMLIEAYDDQQPKDEKSNEKSNEDEDRKEMEFALIDSYDDQQSKNTKDNPNAEEKEANEQIETKEMEYMLLENSDPGVSSFLNVAELSSIENLHDHEVVEGKRKVVGGEGGKSFLDKTQHKFERIHTDANAGNGLSVSPVPKVDRLVPDFSVEIGRFHNAFLQICGSRRLTGNTGVTDYSMLCAVKDVSALLLQGTNDPVAGFRALEEQEITPWEHAPFYVVMTFFTMILAFLLTICLHVVRLRVNQAFFDRVQQSNVLIQLSHVLQLRSRKKRSFLFQGEDSGSNSGDAPLTIPPVVQPVPNSGVFSSSIPGAAKKNSVPLPEKVSPTDPFDGAVVGSVDGLGDRIRTDVWQQSYPTCGIWASTAGIIEFFADLRKIQRSTGVVKSGSGSGISIQLASGFQTNGSMMMKPISDDDDPQSVDATLSGYVLHFCCLDLLTGIEKFRVTPEKFQRVFQGGYSGLQRKSSTLDFFLLARGQGDTNFPNSIYGGPREGLIPRLVREISVDVGSYYAFRIEVFDRKMALVLRTRLTEPFLVKPPWSLSMGPHLFFKHVLRGRDLLVTRAQRSFDSFLRQCVHVSPDMQLAPYDQVQHNDRIVTNMVHAYCSWIRNQMSDESRVVAIPEHVRYQLVNKLAEGGVTEGVLRSGLISEQQNSQSPVMLNVSGIEIAKLHTSELRSGKYVLRVGYIVKGDGDHHEVGGAASQRAFISRPFYLRNTVASRSTRVCFCSEQCSMATASTAVVAGKTGGPTDNSGSAYNVGASGSGGDSRMINAPDGEDNDGEHKNRQEDRNDQKEKHVDVVYVESKGAWAFNLVLEPDQQLTIKLIKLDTEEVSAMASIFIDSNFFMQEYYQRPFITVLKPHHGVHGNLNGGRGNNPISPSQDIFSMVGLVKLKIRYEDSKAVSAAQIHTHLSSVMDSIHPQLKVGFKFDGLTRSILIGNFRHRRIYEGVQNDIYWNRMHPLIRSLDRVILTVRCGQTGKLLRYLSPNNKDVSVDGKSRRGDDRVRLGRVKVILDRMRKIAIRSRRFNVRKEIITRNGQSDSGSENSGSGDEFLARLRKQYHKKVEPRGRRNLLPVRKQRANAYQLRGGSSDVSRNAAKSQWRNSQSYSEYSLQNSGHIMWTLNFETLMASLASHAHEANEAHAAQEAVRDYQGVPIYFEIIDPSTKKVLETSNVFFAHRVLLHQDFDLAYSTYCRIHHLHKAWVPFQNLEEMGANVALLPLQTVRNQRRALPFEVIKATNHEDTDDLFWEDGNEPVSSSYRPSTQINGNLASAAILEPNPTTRPEVLRESFLRHQVLSTGDNDDFVRIVGGPIRAQLEQDSRKTVEPVLLNVRLRQHPSSYAGDQLIAAEAESMTRDVWCRCLCFPIVCCSVCCIQPAAGLMRDGCRGRRKFQEWKEALELQDFSEVRNSRLKVNDQVVTSWSEKSSSHDAGRLQKFSGRCYQNWILPSQRCCDYFWFWICQLLFFLLFPPLMCFPLVPCVIDTESDSILTVGPVLTPEYIGFVANEEWEISGKGGTAFVQQTFEKSILGGKPLDSKAPHQAKSPASVEKKDVSTKGKDVTDTTNREGDSTKSDSKSTGSVVSKDDAKEPDSTTRKEGVGSSSRDTVRANPVTRKSSGPKSDSGTMARKITRRTVSYVPNSVYELSNWVFRNLSPGIRKTDAVQYMRMWRRVEQYYLGGKEFLGMQDPGDTLSRDSPSAHRRSRSTSRSSTPYDSYSFLEEPDEYDVSTSREDGVSIVRNFVPLRGLQLRGDADSEAPPHKGNSAPQYNENSGNYEHKYAEEAGIFVEIQKSPYSLSTLASAPPAVALPLSPYDKAYEEARPRRVRPIDRAFEDAKDWLYDHVYLPWFHLSCRSLDVAIAVNTVLWVMLLIFCIRLVLLILDNLFDFSWMADSSEIDPSSHRLRKTRKLGCLGCRRCSRNFSIGFITIEFSFIIFVLSVWTVFTLLTLACSDNLWECLFFIAGVLYITLRFLRKFVVLSRDLRTIVLRLGEKLLRAKLHQAVKMYEKKSLENQAGSGDNASLDHGAGGGGPGKNDFGYYYSTDHHDDFEDELFRIDDDEDLDKTLAVISNQIDSSGKAYKRYTKEQRALDQDTKIQRSQHMDSSDIVPLATVEKLRSLINEGKQKILSSVKPPELEGSDQQASSSDESSSSESGNDSEDGSDVPAVFAILSKILLDDKMKAKTNLRELWCAKTKEIATQRAEAGDENAVLSSFLKTHDFPTLINENNLRDFEDSAAAKEPADVTDMYASLWDDEDAPLSDALSGGGSFMSSFDFTNQVDVKIMPKKFEREYERRHKALMSSVPLVSEEMLVLDSVQNENLSGVDSSSSDNASINEGNTGNSAASSGNFPATASANSNSNVTSRTSSSSDGVVNTQASSSNNVVPAQASKGALNEASRVSRALMDAKNVRLDLTGVSEIPMAPQQHNPLMSATIGLLEEVYAKILDNEIPARHVDEERLKPENMSNTILGLLREKLMEFQMNQGKFRRSFRGLIVQKVGDMYDQILLNLANPAAIRSAIRANIEKKIAKEIDGFFESIVAQTNASIAKDDATIVAQRSSKVQQTDEDSGESSEGDSDDIAYLEGTGKRSKSRKPKKSKALTGPSMLVHDVCVDIFLEKYAKPVSGSKTLVNILAERCGDAGANSKIQFVRTFEEGAAIDNHISLLDGVSRLWWTFPRSLGDYSEQDQKIIKKATEFIQAKGASGLSASKRSPSGMSDEKFISFEDLFFVFTEAGILQSKFSAGSQKFVTRDLRLPNPMYDTKIARSVRDQIRAHYRLIDGDRDNASGEQAAADNGAGRVVVEATSSPLKQRKKDQPPSALEEQLPAPILRLLTRQTLILPQKVSVFHGSSRTIAEALSSCGVSPIDVSFAAQNRLANLVASINEGKGNEKSNQSFAVSVHFLLPIPDVIRVAEVILQNRVCYGSFLKSVSEKYRVGIMDIQSLNDVYEKYTVVGFQESEQTDSGGFIASEKRIIEDFDTPKKLRTGLMHRSQFDSAIREFTQEGLTLAGLLELLSTLQMPAQVAGFIGKLPATATENFAANSAASAEIGRRNIETFVEGSSNRLGIPRAIAGYATEATNPVTESDRNGRRPIRFQYDLMARVWRKYKSPTGDYIVKPNVETLITDLLIYRAEVDGPASSGANGKENEHPRGIWFEAFFLIVKHLGIPLSRDSSKRLFSKFEVSLRAGEFQYDYILEKFKNHDSAGSASLKMTEISNASLESRGDAAIIHDGFLAREETQQLFGILADFGIYDEVFTYFLRFHGVHLPKYAVEALWKHIFLKVSNDLFREASSNPANDEVKAVVSNDEVKPVAASESQLKGYDGLAESELDQDAAAVKLISGISNANKEPDESSTDFVAQDTSQQRIEETSQKVWTGNSWFANFLLEERSLLEGRSLDDKTMSSSGVPFGETDIAICYREIVPLNLVTKVLVVTLACSGMWLDFVRLLVRDLDIEDVTDDHITAIFHDLSEAKAGILGFEEIYDVMKKIRRLNGIEFPLFRRTIRRLGFYIDDVAMYEVFAQANRRGDRALSVKDFEVAVGLLLKDRFVRIIMRDLGLEADQIALKIGMLFIVLVTISISIMLSLRSLGPTRLVTESLSVIIAIGIPIFLDNFAVLNMQDYTPGVRQAIKRVVQL